MHCTNSVEHKAIKQFALEIVIVIQSCTQSEYYASLELMEAPGMKMPNGESILKRAALFPNDDNMKVALGLFAERKAAIAWTEQGASCERDIRKVLSWFPNTKAILGVGMAYGMDRNAVKLSDVLVSSQIANFSNRLGSHGEVVDTKATLKNVFCEGNTKWTFPCTKSNRLAQVFVGQLASGPFLLNDPTIKQRIQQQCKGGEMEGWVLYTHIAKGYPNLEVIIIKGVADYADGLKDERWQLTAAKAAADYTHFHLKQSTALKGMI